MCKISPPATPNETPIKVDILGDYVFDTLEHNSQTKDNTEFFWLLLTALEKVSTGKNELRASNSQLKLCINKLRVSLFDLKETFTSYSCKADF